MDIFSQTTYNTIVITLVHQSIAPAMLRRRDDGAVSRSFTAVPIQCITHCTCCQQLPDTISDNGPTLTVISVRFTVYRVHPCQRMLSRQLLQLDLERSCTKHGRAHRRNGSEDHVSCMDFTSHSAGNSLQGHFCGCCAGQRLATGNSPLAKDTEHEHTICSASTYGGVFALRAPCTLLL